MITQKVLIVDDEKDLRDALKSTLESAGIATIEAEDGSIGLERALSEKPDLILLDVNMPNMGGHQMLNKLRADDWGKNVQVLLLTNADDATNITHGVEQGMNDYIIKSKTSLQDILKKVKQHLAGYHD